jgi:Cu(I)/Ag(I) efflux system membrane fusion protein
MKKNIFLSLLIGFLIGAGVSYFIVSNPNNNSGTQARKILYWAAPMNSSYHRDKPGKSPMGMDLVPVYDDGGKPEVGVIKISPSVENNLGIKTERVKKMDLSRMINTVGYVTVDENNIEHIHTYADGWIKTLNVKTTGEPVKKGDLLLELYSPTLNNAQQEFLLALKNKNAALIRAGEKKLITLGMSQSQINRLRNTRKVMEHIRIYATQSGIVSHLNVREGKFVKPDTDLMTIVDLSNIWIIAEVFERQADWVKEGEQAVASLPYIPGKMWQGEIDYVYPELDQTTHTLRVRLLFPNPDLMMKPKMYADVKIFAKTQQDALAIPRAALIRTGDGDRVIIALDNGRFMSKPIKIGIESGDYYQVISGLKTDERIVTSAQFLIDSESSIQAGLNRMDASSDSTTNHTPQEFVGMGRVLKVSKSNRTVSIKHQPIPALDMPEMTMDLPVGKEVNMEALKADDVIHFVLIKTTNGHYLVIKIHAM